MTDNGELLTELRIPFSAEDLREHRLDACTRLLLLWPDFARRGHARTADLLAQAMGYANAASVVTTVSWGPALRLQLPKNFTVLQDILAWRLYLLDRIPPGVACYALHALFTRINLTLCDLYDYGMVNPGGSEEGEDWWMRLPPEGLDTLDASLKRAHRVLTADGRLLHEGIYEAGLRVATKHWSADCGVPLATMASDLVESSWLELDAAIPLYNHELSPPGFWPVTYEAYDGRRLGYGYYSYDLNGYLAYVYPDHDTFLQAARALWLNEPVPPSQLAKSCSHVFASDYDNGYLPPRQPQQLSTMDQAERQDIMPGDPDALPLNQGRLDLGHTLTFKGTPLTRPPYHFSRDNFEPCLGFTLQTCPLDESHDWLLHRAPVVLPEATVHLLDDLCYTLDQRGRLGHAKLVGQEYPDRVKACLHRIQTHRWETTAYGSDRQMEGTLNMVRAFDVPEAGRVIREVYPDLAPVPIEVLGEYALDFWSKNEIRRGQAHYNYDVKFLGYALLRHLGCDPFNYFGHHPYPWLTLLDMALEALAPWPPDAATQARLVAEAGRQLQTWGRACQDLLAIPDLLDNSFTGTWLFEAEAPAGYRRFSTR